MGTAPVQLLEEAIAAQVEVESDFASDLSEVHQELARCPVRHKRLETSCPECGQTTIVCCHGELRHQLDSIDLFCHVCLNPDCTFGVYQENRVQVGQENAQDQLCPWCKRDVIKDAMRERQEIADHNS